MTCTPGQINATYALLKFCREHNHSGNWIECTSECLTSLETGDEDNVRRCVHLMWHAGMGSFMDWYPEVAHPHEDQRYVDATWNALLGYWMEQMQPFKPKRR